MENMITQQQQIHSGPPFKRTICSCNICRTNCKVIPGYLIYNDLINIYHFINPVVKFEQFIELYFLASDGAIVMKNCNIFRIPTIVPKRNNQGYCIFLTNEEKCKIHSVAPFGCRYFDCKQTKEEADYISKYGLSSILENTVYKDIWLHLKNKNLVAIPPEQTRKNFN